MAKRKAAAVSMEEALFEAAKKRAEELGFPTFSAYAVQLLRNDLRARGDLSIVAEARQDDEPAPIAPAPKAVDYRDLIKPKKGKAK